MAYNDEALKLIDSLEHVQTWQKYCFRKVAHTLLLNKRQSQTSHHGKHFDVAAVLT